VCWSIVVKEKPTVDSSFFGAFLLTTSLRWRRTSVYIYLFRITIPVNYTNEFREHFETTIVYSSCGSPIHLTLPVLTFNFARINVEFLTELRYTSVLISFSKLGYYRTTLGRFHQKSSNRSMSMLEYREKFQVCLEISWEYLSGIWQYWSNILAQPTACLFSTFPYLQLQVAVLCLNFIHKASSGYEKFL
jgi:hypothetical protein